MAETTELKICSIGCGGMSSYAHGPSYARYASEHPGALLAACCDLDERKAIEFKKSFGFARHYTDMVEMLERERPDAVCLVVPEVLTCDIACEILSMGFPLLMEKPPGRTTEEIDRMIDAAGPIPNRVAFNRRYTPLVGRLRNMLAGLFDPHQIQHVRYTFTRVGRTDADFSLTAIHGIDAARFLVGSDYEHIRFRYREFPELGPTTANILMDCAFESGTTAHLEFCPVMGVDTESVTVYAHDHAFYLSIPMWNEFNFEGSLRHFYRGKLQEEIVYGDKDSARFVINGFYAENESFFSDLQSGKKPAGDLKNARQSVEVMQCLRERKAEYLKHIYY